MQQYITKPATIEDIQDFISWLETQHGTYNAQDTENCPVVRYLKERGHTEVSFNGMYELYADGNYINLPKIIGLIVYGTDTYQMALDRARKIYVDMIYAIKPSEDPGADNSDSENGHFA